MIDDFFDIGWEEMALAGSLAEEMTEEEKERRKVERGTDLDQCDSCCEEADPCDLPDDKPYEPPDEDPYP